MSYKVSKLALINIIIGFWLIFIASSGGFFIADWQKNLVLNNKFIELLSWWGLIAKSSHGHTNLFGMLHILFGLTLEISTMRIIVKYLQTVAFFMGSLAMSVLLFIRSYHKPTFNEDVLSVIIGFLLSIYLLGILTHIIALSYSLVKYSTKKI